jgi:tRNA dimethylallyltransferase
MPGPIKELLKLQEVQEPLKIPVLIFFGPTGSGKTELLEAWFTQRGKAFYMLDSAGVEVVSADSMQVYRGMDIGTAKPSLELRTALPHHLVDIRNPDEQFNVGAFVHLADQCCIEIAKRGGLPVVSGGTGFYLKHFVLGLPEAPPSDPKVRADLKEELRIRGIAALMEELAGCDPESAGRIHIHDEYRLLRALEVFRITQRPLSSFSPSGAVPLGSRPNYRFLIIGLEREREELYRRIDERCASMFHSGLPEEVRRLFEAGYGPRSPGLRAIGYKEFFEEGAHGECRFSTDLAAVKTLVARNSRRYAKRQITYFASIPGVIWIPASLDPTSRVLTLLRAFHP